MKTDFEGLYNNPTPWRVYMFFIQHGGFIGPTPFGLMATFRDERDAKRYVDENSTHRTSFRIVNESEILP